jgi:hypothetical protein
LVNKIININKENNKYEEINSNGSTCVFKCGDFFCRNQLCGPANSDKTKQTTPAKDTKKEKKVKKQVQKKDDKNTKDTNKTSGTCKIK